MQCLLLFSVASAGSFLGRHDQERVSEGKFTYVKVGGCNSNPGAGFGDHQPFTKVYKDGFYHVECMMDNMEYAADANGDNKMSYDNKANVTIVRYQDVVDRERQERMTPLVCFNFCRTIDQMLYFGLIYGRECYCEPYYERTPGKGVCDLPCEGDSGSICGGKHMTSMYEMHTCADTGNDLQNAMDASSDILEISGGVGSNATDFATALESSADAMMATSTKGGDMASNNYGQQAKVWAGELLHAGERATAAKNMLASEFGVARGLLSRDFTVADNAYAAEKTIRNLTSLSSAASAAAEEADPMASATTPEVSAADSARALPLFMGVMEVIDHWKDMESAREERAHKHTQATCVGELAGKPIVGLDYAGCAQACDTHAPKSSEDFCVAFQHYTLDAGEAPLCFLLKGVKSVWEYDCNNVHVPNAPAADGESTTTSTTTTPAVGGEGTACGVRGSWGLETPLKPEVNFLDRCFGEEMAGTETTAATSPAP